MGFETATDTGPRSFFDTAKENIQDLIHGDPTAELEEFFDVDFPSYELDDLAELQELKRNLKSRKESERMRAERPARVKQPGQEAKTIAAKAERRIEWLKEKIGGAERRIAEIEERQTELVEEARKAEAQAQEEMSELAADALGVLEDLSEKIGRMAEARADVVEAKNKADMPKRRGRVHPVRSATSKVNELKSTLQKMSKSDE